jgi:hypothetical protein
MYLDGRLNDQKRNAIELLRFHAGERDATVDPLRFTPKSMVADEKDWNFSSHAAFPR